MSRRGICLLLCGLAAWATPRHARAAVFLHDQFLVNGPLAGTTPMPGPGPAWIAGAGTEIPIQVVNGEAVVVQSDGSPNGQEAQVVIGAQSATAITFARFDFRLPSADNTTVATDPDVADGGVFFVSLRASGASALRARTGLLNPTGDGDFRLAINADSSNLGVGAIWPTELDFDSTYRAVISFDASNSESKLWLNPVNEMSASVSHTGASAGTLIDRINLRQNDDYAGKQLIDNLVIASTFAEALSGGVAPGVPGDYNGNNVVDAADYVVWRAAQTAGASTLDNRDPIQSGNPVGAPDYDYWRARFGNASGSASGGLASSVPEPVTVTLLVAGVAAWSLARRRTV